MMLKHALKEWAVICRGLADGTQSLLLRKGGIDEAAGAFALEHTRFWLMPTYTHQQRDGIAEKGRALLAQTEADRPAAERICLTHWAEVTGVYQIGDVVSALLLSHMHLFSDETVRQRFAYRSPGLCVLTIRVYRAPHRHEIADRPEYKGCHSWVELVEPLSAEGSVPVLDDAAYRDIVKGLDLLLNPVALA